MSSMEGSSGRFLMADVSLADLQHQWSQLNAKFYVMLLQMDFHMDFAMERDGDIREVHRRRDALLVDIDFLNGQRRNFRSLLDTVDAIEKHPDSLNNPGSADFYVVQTCELLHKWTDVDSRSRDAWISTERLDIQWHCLEEEISGCETFLTGMKASGFLDSIYLPDVEAEVERFTTKINDLVTRRGRATDLFHNQSLIDQRIKDGLVTKIMHKFDATKDHLMAQKRAAEHAVDVFHRQVEVADTEDQEDAPEVPGESEDAPEVPGESEDAPESARGPGSVAAPAGPESGSSRPTATKQQLGTSGRRSKRARDDEEWLPPTKKPRKQPTREAPSRKQPPRKAKQLPRKEPPKQQEPTRRNAKRAREGDEGLPARKKQNLQPVVLLERMPAHQQPRLQQQALPPPPPPPPPLPEQIPLQHLQPVVVLHQLPPQHPQPVVAVQPVPPPEEADPLVYRSTLGGMSLRTRRQSKLSYFKPARRRQTNKVYTNNATNRRWGCDGDPLYSAAAMSIPKQL